MRINPVSFNHVNFKGNENNHNVSNNSSPLKKAAKAIVIVPFIMPFAMVGCDKEYNFDIEREFDNCYKDTTATDSSHHHYESRVIAFPVSKLDIKG